MANPPARKLTAEERAIAQRNFRAAINSDRPPRGITKRGGLLPAERQRDIALRLLKTGPVSTLDLQEVYGVVNPAALMYALKKSGHIIDKIMIHQNDQKGFQHCIAQYALAKQSPPEWVQALIFWDAQGKKIDKYIKRFHLKVLRFPNIYGSFNAIIGCGDFFQTFTRVDGVHGICLGRVNDVFTADTDTLLAKLPAGCDLTPFSPAEVELGPLIRFLKQTIRN